MTGYIKVKNFERFQHYKDRKPVWIKLYNDLLDDYEFGCLPDASKWLAVGLWLLASRYDNRIPADPTWIGRRINSTDPVDLEPLVSAGFIELYQNASEPIADASAPAMPETEEETDTEGDTSIHPQTSTRAGEVIPLRVISGAGPPDDREELVSRIIRAANAGMAANPAIDQARFRPIPTTHGSRQYVLDWLAEGIDADVILEAVSERARQYQPDGRHRQISTMAYFDAAIRDEVERRRATEEGGNYDHHRGRSTPNGRGASSSARPVALGAGDPARRSGWVYE